MIVFPAVMLILATSFAASTSMTVVANPLAIESPCNKICAVDPACGLCIGCGRSLAEITHWIGYDAAERARIMAELPQRLASLRATAANRSKRA